MTDIFVLLIEESNCEDTERDIEVFSDTKTCHAYLEKKVDNYKTYTWSKKLKPPSCPYLKEIESLSTNELHTIYEFEHQTPDHGSFFCINMFIKKMTL